MENITVTVSGFKTKEEAEEFINWYSGQGEQDCAYWLDARKSEGLPVSDFLPVDCLKTFDKGKLKSDNNNYKMVLKSQL